MPVITSYLLLNVFIFLPQDATAHDSSMQILELLGVVNTSEATQRLNECGSPLQDDHISPLERDLTDSPEGNHTGPTNTSPTEDDHASLQEADHGRLTEGAHAGLKEGDHASLQEDDHGRLTEGAHTSLKDSNDHTGPSEGDHTGPLRSTWGIYRGPSEGPRREGYTCMHGEESPHSYYDQYPSYLPDSPPPLSPPVPPLRPSYHFRSDPIPYSYAPSSASSDAGYSRWQVRTHVSRY